MVMDVSIGTIMQFAMEVPLPVPFEFIEDADDRTPPEGRSRSLDDLVKQLRIHARKVKWHRARMQSGIKELKDLIEELSNE